MKIFDMKQADWLIKEGCIVIGSGLGKQDGKSYILFQSDEHFQACFKRYRH